MKQKILSPIFLLCLLIIFHTCGNIIWISLNNLPPGWDEAAHMKGAIEYGYFFSQFLQGNFNLDLWRIPFQNPYPPFVKLVAGVLITLLYPDIKLLQLTSTVYFTGSIILIYLLGKRLYHNAWVGLLAAFFFSFYLHTFDRSRVFELDIPLTFFTLLTLWLVIQNEYFKHTGKTLLLAATVAIAVLTKIQAVIYLSPILLYGLWRSRNNLRDTQTQKNIAYSIAIGALILIPWLMFNLDSITSYTQLATTQEFEDPNRFSLTSLFFYLNTLLDAYLTWVGIAIFFLATALCIFRHKRQDLLIFGYLLIVYLILTLIPNKNIRFLMPIVPFVALIQSRGLVSLLAHRTIIRSLIVLSLIAYSSFLYINLSFAWPFPRDNFSTPYTIVRRYDPSKTPLDNMVLDLKQYFNGAPAEIVFIPNPEYFGINTFNMYLRLYNINNVTAVQPRFSSLNPSAAEVESVLTNYPYYYYTESYLGLPWLIASADNTMQTQVQQYVTAGIRTNKMEKVFNYVLPTVKQDTVWFIRKFSP